MKINIFLFIKKTPYRKNSLKLIQTFRKFNYMSEFKLKRSYFEIYKYLIKKKLL